jgi:hypothetical protein
MSYRRRHRWFRRLALGLAFASVMFAGRASVAAAKTDEVTKDAHQTQVIPYLSHGVLTQADADVAASAAQPQKPRLSPYIPLFMERDFSAWQTDVPVRPDDVADRFSHSDVVSRVEPTNGDNWRLEWTDALPLGIGVIVLAIALGLALGHLRRPRLAGL